jgi:hypothetical protein
MEDLIYLLVIAIAVSIAAMLAATALAVAATVATICVIGAAMHAFATTMYRGALHRGGDAAAAGPGEPSFRAYYRGQVWTDLGIAARAAWRRALEETGHIRGMVPQSWNSAVRVVVSFALSVYAFVGLAVGALLAGLILIVPAAAIALFALGAWALGAPLRAWERLRRKRSGAFFDCPECHDRFPLPQYVCPECDARHQQLAPGPFGVQRHRCTCGAYLPALPTRGRDRLVAECPQGHSLGEGVGTVRTFHVPVAGGPSTGKSAFLAAALVELEGAATAGTLATAVQTSSRQAYDRILSAFRQGVPPTKTSGLPPAVVAEVSGRSKSALLYAYDVAGEVYGVEDELRRDPAHGLAEGVVLLIDPFALDRVKAELEEEIDETAELRPSAEPPQRMLERLVGVLSEQGIDLKKLSAAICVTKVDALGIGDAIAACSGDHDHARTREWLEQSGAGNFLRATEDAFREVRCFPVSALGRLPGTGSGAFTPNGALTALLWLLSTAGIQPAAPGEAQTTTTEKLKAAAPLSVKPKRPLFKGPIDVVVPMPNMANFSVGLVTTGALALATVPFASIGGSVDYGEEPFAHAAITGTTTPSDTTGSPEPTWVEEDDQYPEETPDLESEETVEPEGTVEPDPPPADEPKQPRPGSPAGILTQHFESITAGDYGTAFTLMSSRYRTKNPNWELQPAQSEPYINLAEVGPTKFLGNGVARVRVKFYGRDRYATEKSDTACRRFEGNARMVRESGEWRYDGGDGYTTTVLPSHLKVCNP